MTYEPDDMSHCCYVGQFISQISKPNDDYFSAFYNFMIRNHPNLDVDKFEGDLSKSAFEKDEDKATELFKSINYEVEFIGEYPNET
jgi:hypothetical protein